MRPFIVFAFAVASGGAAALVLACTDQTNPSFAASAPVVDS